MEPLRLHHNVCHLLITDTRRVRYNSFRLWWALFPSQSTRESLQRSGGNALRCRGYITGAWTTTTARTCARTALLNATHVSPVRSRCSSCQYIKRARIYSPPLFPYIYRYRGFMWIYVESKVEKRNPASSASGIARLRKQNGMNCNNIRIFLSVDFEIKS